MNIAHVVYSCIPGSFRGGVPKVVFELGQAQASLGHRVAIYTTDLNSGIRVKVPVNESVDVGGIEIRYFRALENIYYSSPSLARNLMKAGRDYDIIHSHNTFLALNSYAAKTSKHWQIPLFYHVHGALDPLVVRRGQGSFLKKAVYIRLFERSHYGAAQGLIALTQNEASQLAQYNFPTPVYIVPNGLDTTGFPPSAEMRHAFRRQYGIGPDKSVILYLGRIARKKSLHLLISAFAQVAREMTDTTLVIAGDRAQDPQYVRELDKIVTEHGLLQKVIWTGYLTEQEKRFALAAGDVFSHVSESEGMPISVLEAMAARLPVILSQGCYMPDAVNKGVVIESPHSEHELAQTLRVAMTRAAENTDIGDRAYDYVVSHHSWKNIAEQLTRLYEKHRVTLAKNEPDE